MRDIPELMELINSYAAQGIMLPRNEFEMAENIRDFLVAENGSGLSGCAALHFYTPVAAEIRSVAVATSVKGKESAACWSNSLETRSSGMRTRDVVRLHLCSRFLYARLAFRRLTDPNFR